jgi:hypothetical protein
MRTKVIAAAAGLAALACIAAPISLAIRYPDKSIAESAGYVVQRAGSLIEGQFTASPHVAAEGLEAELANVRRVALEIKPGLEALPPLDLALALRDMVYRMVPLPRDIPGKQPATNFIDLPKTVSLALLDDKVGHSCGGLTIVYLTLLKAFGIDARYVGLFHEVVDAADPVISHATVDVLIDGRWVALDPTFNFSIRAGGERIGWEEARALVLDGEPITFDTDGYALLPRRSVGEYRYPLTDSMVYMAFGPSPRSDLRLLPASWNGLITYANGKRFDQRASLAQGPIYVKLAQPTH